MIACFVFLTRAHNRGPAPTSVNAHNHFVCFAPAPVARAVVDLRINRLGARVLATREPVCLR